MNYKKFISSVWAGLLALIIVITTLTVGITSLISAEQNDAIEYSDVHSFETGTKDTYLRNVQTDTFGNEANIDVTLSDEQAEHGTQSFKVVLNNGAAKGQYVNLNLEHFAPEGGKWYNLKVFVPEDSNTDKLSLTYTNTSGTIKKSDTYYFDDNGNSNLSTDEVRQKGKWVTMSVAIPTDISLRCVGIYTESFESSNAGAVFYIDSYSVTDKALDGIRYLDMTDPAVLHSFEAGTKDDYIRNVQTNSYATENKISISISKEQAEAGKKSMKIKMLDGAAKGQYINLNLAKFNPEGGKWYNLKVYVPEGSSTDKISLTYTNTSGTIKKSDTYYFDDNGNSNLSTDEVRQKGKWVTMSVAIPTDISLRCVGIYTESFESSNAGAVFYVDSYSATDKALDDIRYLDMTDPAVLHSFEAGTKDDYIRNIQTNDYKDEKNISIKISKEQAEAGKKSMKIEMLSGAAKGQYINLNLAKFKPEGGKWYNLKVYVPEGSSTDKISLTYTNKSGTVKNSDTYYFDDNGNNSLVTDEVREKGKWITLSLQLAASVDLRCIGLYTESFEDSDAGAVFYVDSYEVTDMPLDAIRYLDMSNPEVRHGFESGAKDDYIRNIQTNDYKDEKKISVSVTSAQKESGKKSMMISLSKGAAKGQYINLLLEYFKPEAGKWFNFKVFVPEGSATQKMALVYTNAKGSISKSDIYYFENNDTNSVKTDKIREKGKWVTISFQIPAKTELRCIGIYIESFSDTTAGSIFYLDSYSVSDEPLDEVRYPKNITKPEGMIIDFESGAATEYIYMTQDQEWKSVLGYASAVTSYRAADGERSLYFRTTKNTVKHVDIFFPTNTIPPKSRFVNVKIFVEEDNKGLDYVSLMYLADNGTESKGLTFYFANNEKGTITEDKMYKKGQWVTLSMYIPNNVKIRRAGIRIGSLGNNGFDKAVFIDSYSTSMEPLDKTRKYYMQPEVEIPTVYNPGINRVQLTNDALYNGINVLTGDYLNTSIGKLRVSDLTLDAVMVDSGKLYDKLFLEVGGKQMALYNISMLNKQTSVTLADTMQINFNAPETIDIKTAKVYFVDENGATTELKHTYDFETITVETDKLGYFMIMGDKAENGKLEFMKVIKPIAPKETEEDFLWWYWIIIAGGVLVVVAGVAVTVVVIIKKKKAVAQ